MHSPFSFWNTFWNSYLHYEMIILPIRKIINSFFVFFEISFKKYNLWHLPVRNTSAPSHALSIIHSQGKCYKLYLCIFLRNSYGIPSFSENCSRIHTIQAIFPGYPYSSGDSERIWRRDLWYPRLRRPMFCSWTERQAQGQRAIPLSCACIPGYVNTHIPSILIRITRIK